ncbi:MAG: alpha-glucosidase [Lachnospiraceae bacterium]|nr:alpha-glucosidase [Lachnospiraceae bacterium]
MMRQYDFRKMSFYQIWIRSFCDGNGDGIGDLYGVYDKLEYIRDLGVDGIWFSPIFPSPNADYGYDISDYRDIHPDYGTLEQFQKVLNRAHELGLKVLLDLVINHTSDEHPWFLESCKGKDNPYSDYYIWRDPLWKGETRLPPNNWYSQFEGLAWEYNAQREQYYLHVFARKQPDLNMDNPKVREEVKDIMRFWLDMGGDGFRGDVITFISKDMQLPDGIPFVPAINGLPFYKDGPNLVTYLKEFREVTREYGVIQVGEAPYTGVATALTYISGRDRVLDMMIQFDTMMADCFMTEYVYHGFRLRKLKHAFTKWQYGLAGKAWNALYLENHDHPRVIDRYGSLIYWKQSGKMLAACYILQPGTPFIYQGQEIGMTNIALDSIDKYLDVASINAFHSFHLREPEEKRLHRIHLSSRDSARTPVQWSGSRNAGFTTGKPWFYINPNYRQVNVEAEEKDPESILHFYRTCLSLRKRSATLLHGDYHEYFRASKKIYMYSRTWKGERILVICSFSGSPVRYRLPKGFDRRQAKLLLCNYPSGRNCTRIGKGGKAGLLQPYEVQVLRWKR